jgi:hypothetical protein
LWNSGQKAGGADNLGAVVKFAPPTIANGEVWADRHCEATGRWPTCESGPVLGAPDETWRAVEMALYEGLRGLRGGSSVAKLLAKHRGVRNIGNLPRLTVKQILRWADAHFRRTGSWPTYRSGPVQGAKDETWKAIEMALQRGRRGLRRSSSLHRVLIKHGRLKAPAPAARV